MIQHPIPQNISTYQFHLVGDMTLKQFLELMAGFGVAALFYATNLFGPLKLIFVILSALLGFALAFMPVEERPLDQWLLAFIRAIYAPTLFIWRKSTRAPSFFSFVAHSTIITPEAQQLIAAQIARKKAGLSTFLMTLPQNPSLTALETQESANLNRVLGYFTKPLASPKPIGVGGTTPITELPKITLPKPIMAPLYAPSQIHPVPTPISQPPTTLSIPATPLIRVEPLGKPLPLVVNTGPAQATPQPASNTLPSSKIQNPTAPAVTQTTLPFPSPPQTPNTVVGMVLNVGGKIIDNAIIEIRDKSGLPVRATKTNRLGQFFSTTPLKNGVYEIETEAPNHTFTVVKLTLDGRIVDPLKIQSTN